jgi:hypothetical protein
VPRPGRRAPGPLGHRFSPALDQSQSSPNGTGGLVVGGACPLRGKRARLFLGRKVWQEAREDAHTGSVPSPPKPPWSGSSPSPTRVGSSSNFTRDAKQECGLDHYQGRSWTGLHRHLALVLLAYSFLMLQRLIFPQPSGRAFSPLRHAKLAAWRPSAGVALALPGSHPLAALHPAVRFLLSQTKLTE